MSSNNSHPDSNALTYIKLSVVALLWGGTFIAGRLIAQQLPHMIAAFLRFAIALGFLLPLLKIQEGRLPQLSRQQFQATFALGATGIFLYNLCFFAALSRMPAGRTALFVALNPSVTALALVLFMGEKLSWQRYLGIALAFFGASIVISRGELWQFWRDISQALGAGEMFMLCAVSAWAAYTIIGRHALKGLSPLAATTYAALWGTLLLGMGAVLELPQLNLSHLNWQVWLALLYLGAGGTFIGFVWYYQGVKQIGPARAAIFNNLVPVFGVSLAAILLNEPILKSMLLGGALTIAGVFLTNR